MDVPTPINNQNTQINNFPRENEHLININGVLTQILYKDSLNEKEKKEYEQKNYICCCCGKGQNKYICQIFILYIILFCFIICSMIFRISTIPMYNILRNKDLANFKLYSTGYSIDFVENTIFNSNQIETSNNNYTSPSELNYTYPPQFNCSYYNYINGNCSRLQYELENGCNFHNYYVRDKCTLSEYQNYCDSINYNAGYCYYYDYQVYKREYFHCIYYDMRDGKCSYEQYTERPYNNYFVNYLRKTSDSIGYIIDCGNVKFFCDFKKLKKMSLFLELF